LQNVSFVTNSKRSHAGSLQLLYSQPLLRGFGQEIATANLTLAGYSDLSSQLSLKSKLSSRLDRVPKLRLGTQWGNSISRVFIALFLKWNFGLRYPMEFGNEKIVSKVRNIS
jgi:hypothetical protein